MEKLSVGQLKTASMIMGNISVGWFVTGVINPILSPISNSVDFVIKIIVSLIAGSASAFFALKIVKKVQI